jgi:hypothetical protein
MWPLCFISDKLFKMPGDDAGEGPLPPDGQIPLARRSYSIDVSSSSSPAPFSLFFYDWLDVLFPTVPPLLYM